MLISNTVILYPEALGKKLFTRTGLAEFASNLIFDTYQAINSAMIEQAQSHNELFDAIRLTEDNYANIYLTSGDVQEFIDQNPQLDLVFDEAKLFLARREQATLRTLAKTSMPSIKIDSGTIKSNLLFSFSKEENTQQFGGNFLPKATVRPPSTKSVERNWAGSIAGEIKINFSIINNLEQKD